MKIAVVILRLSVLIVQFKGIGRAAAELGFVQYATEGALEFCGGTRVYFVGFIHFSPFVLMILWGHTEFVEGPCPNPRSYAPAVGLYNLAMYRSTICSHEVF